MKRRFFVSKFIMFLSLTLIPICIFGFFSRFYIHSQVRKEAMEKADAVSERMQQTINELTTTLDIYRITTSSDARFHLALLTALSSESTKNVDMSDLTQAMQSLYYSLTTRPYVQSMYITMKDSPYFINGLNREAFEDSTDSSWAEPALSSPEGNFFRMRYIKKNKFDVNLQPVVTVYQQIKYGEIMAVNLRPEFFNTWLDSITEYDQQILLITDKNGQIFFYNKNLSLLPNPLYIEDNMIDSLDGIAASIGNEYFFNGGTLSESYHLNYISLIPQKEVFYLSNIIRRLTLGGIIFSVVLSSILAYLYTLRDYQQISLIIDLFDKAEKGEFDPPEEYSRHNEAYFHIIKNIINLFMSESYLRVQLDAKKYALLTAQLSALQYQLNPHFLFNTLQSIDLEILKATKRPISANRMISQLSRLLRYSLTSPTTPVTVEEDIEATKSYIDLQALRFGEPFQVFWDCNSDAASYHVPRLILQPIIENSITHSSLPDLSQLKIKIRFRVHENGLSILIIDNGLGMDSERLETLRQKISDDQVEGTGHHIGLKNISQRIRLTYPNGYIKVWSKLGMGTIIEIGGINP